MRNHLKCIPAVLPLAWTTLFSFLSFPPPPASLWPCTADPVGLCDGSESQAEQTPPASPPGEKCVSCGLSLILGPRLSCGSHNLRLRVWLRECARRGWKLWVPPNALHRPKESVGQAPKQPLAAHRIATSGFLSIVEPHLRNPSLRVLIDSPLPQALRPLHSISAEAQLCQHHSTLLRASFLAMGC